MFVECATLMGSAGSGNPEKSYYLNCSVTYWLEIMVAELVAVLL